MPNATAYPSRSGVPIVLLVSCLPVDICSSISSGSDVVHGRDSDEPSTAEASVPQRHQRKVAIEMDDHSTRKCGLLRGGSYTLYTDIDGILIY